MKISDVFSPNCHFKRFDQLTTFDNHNLVCTESIYSLEDLSIYLVKTLITFADDKKVYSQELQFCRWTRFLVSEYPVCTVCIQVRVHVPFPFPRLDNIKIVKNNDSFIISIAVGISLSIAWKYLVRNLSFSRLNYRNPRASRVSLRYF